MAKIAPVVTILVATFLLNQPATALASARKEAASSADLLVAEKQDLRAQKLEDFLASYDSPLTPFAYNFVKVADKYGLDWRLLPAITGVESTFGKAIPPGSFNAYGWVNGAYYFTSWEDSIEIVAKTLRENYFDKGVDTVKEMAPIYAPPSKTWAAKVLYFMEKITNFAPSHTLALEFSF